MTKLVDRFNLEQSGLVTPFFPSSVSDDIMERLKGINHRFAFWHDSALVKKLENVQPVELAKILNFFFEDLIEKGSIEEAASSLDRLASLIPARKLQETATVPNLLKEIETKVEQAKLYLNSKSAADTPLTAHLLTFFNAFIAVIEGLINVFGLAEFFKPADNEAQAEAKSNVFFRITGIFSILTSTLLPLFGAAAGAQIIAIIILSISVLSLIWPFIKPMPTYLPANAENWSKQVQEKSVAVYGRKDKLERMYKILKRNRHVILTGPSRVGKSLTAKAFAEAILKGDYPDFKGKVVFRINTADLLKQQASFLGGGNNILHQISSKMGRHRNDIILVLDEIHMACANNEPIANQLKTMLDRDGAFPHVIGITTEQEYKDHIQKDPAFNNRFKEVNIKSTDVDETVKILGDAILTHPDAPIIEADTVQQVYAKSSADPQAPQPTTALDLLELCVASTERAEKTPLEKKILFATNRILSLRTVEAASRGKYTGGQEEIERLERDLVQWQENLLIEKQKLDKLYQAKATLDKTTIDSYRSILKIAQCAQRKLDEKQSNLYLLLTKFFQPSLEAHIKKESEHLGINLIIDRSVVEQHYLSV
ncbi:MAG TPA: AAA family ATPase [Rhabdochlamydiaceae bacterium]|nr:AAA family ATPase [Rhabdochlamydiaceae bacterium]